MQAGEEDKYKKVRMTSAKYGGFGRSAFCNHKNGKWHITQFTKFLCATKIKKH